MSDMDDLLTDFHSRGNAAAAMVEMLTVAGFKDHEVRIIPGKMEFTGYNEIKANVTVINPVWLKMNAEEQNEYLKDYLDIAAGMGIYKEADDQSESTFSFSYQLLNVHAAK
ncbi:uncharacterized protein LOC119646163 [Hermetia illucens]|nr:uncharacterized protein LOC119646163 [Hermetia illucens]